MMNTFHEVNSLYYAMRILRHRIDVSNVVLDQVKKDLSSDTSVQEVKLALRIIKGIREEESMPTNGLDDSRIDKHLVQLSLRVQELTKLDLLDSGFGIENGDHLLMALRGHSEGETTIAEKGIPVGAQKAAFEIGQTVVYPNHGIGIIEQIEKKQLGMVALRLYTLRLAATNSLALVPVSNASDEGLRRPISSVEGEILMKVLADSSSFMNDLVTNDWKDRFKAFSGQMRTGNIFEVADVLKNLTFLASIKPLSFREQRMLERARYLVISELSFVLNQRESEIRIQVDQSLERACAKYERAARRQRITPSIVNRKA